MSCVQCDFAVDGVHTQLHVGGHHDGIPEYCCQDDHGCVHEDCTTLNFVKEDLVLQ